jgi:hypothetical protein
MRVPTRHLFSTDEYYRMAETFFDECKSVFENDTWDAA